MSKRLLVTGCLITTLTGCGPHPVLQEAASNYIIDNCPSAFGIDNSKDFIVSSSSPTRDFSFYCPEEDGVKTYTYTYDQIPSKYWEKNNEK